MPQASWPAASCAALLIGVVGGCRTDNQPERHASQTPLACDLITPTDIQAVAGGAPGPGTGMAGSAGISTCQYAMADGSYSLMIRISPTTGAAEHAAFPFRNPQPVPGLGDDAKFAQQAVPADETADYDPGSALSVLKGAVEISIFYSGKGDRLTISKALAEKALARL